MQQGATARRRWSGARPPAGESLAQASALRVGVLSPQTRLRERDVRECACLLSPLPVVVSDGSEPPNGSALTRAAPPRQHQRGTAVCATDDTTRKERTATRVTPCACDE